VCIVHLRQPHHACVHAVRRQLLDRHLRRRARIPRGCRAVLCRVLVVAAVRDGRPGGNDKRPVRAQHHLRDGLDRLAVVITVLLELREVVVEGQMNDAVCPCCSVAQAFEVLDVAMEYFGPSRSQLLSARLLSCLRQRVSTYFHLFVVDESCMILLTNSDNGELAFRPLLETILGDTATPWEWERYTPALIEEYWKANP